jgi:hypothetical protein
MVAVDRGDLSVGSMSNIPHPSSHASNEDQIELFDIVPDRPLDSEWSTDWDTDPDGIAKWLGTQSDEQLRLLLETVSRNTGVKGI